METENVNSRVFITNNVAMEYMAFLFMCVKDAGFEPIAMNYMGELEYRVGTSTNRANKISLRFKLFVLYPIWATIQVHRKAKKGDWVIATSSTPFVPLLLAIHSKWKKTKVVHLLYDLFPDALEVSGNITKSGVASKMLSWMQTHTQRKTWGTVALGEVLLQHLECRYGPSKRRAVIPISANASVYPQKKPMAIDATSETLVFHYGGHLGAMHEAELLIACIKACLETSWANKTHWEFRISGSYKKRLKEALPYSHVRVLAATQADQWRDEISAYHVGLVTASPGASKLLLPSKSYGMMAGGLAIIALAPEWSDLSQMLYRTGSGWVVNNDSTRAKQQIVETFVNTVAQIVEDQKELNARRQAAWMVMREEFGLSSISQQWKEFLKD